MQVCNQKGLAGEELSHGPGDCLEKAQSNAAHLQAAPNSYFVVFRQWSIWRTLDSRC